jgi:glycosyl transferase family 25
MQSYVINLVRSADRRAYITDQLRKTQINYVIVNAVDGRDLDLSDTRVVDPVFASTDVAQSHPGVVGCALSHMEIYRRILADGLEIACVLEDDVVLPTDLGLLTEAITRYMRGAEVVLLNFQSPEPCQVTKDGSEQLPASRFLVQFVDEDQAASTGGYLITRDACARMVKAMSPVRTVADNWALFCREGAIDRLRCVVPMPVVQDPALRTTMSYYRRGSLYATLREAVASSRLPILHQALAIRRRRHLRRYAIGRTEFVEEFPGGSPGPQESRLL